MDKEKLNDRNELSLAQKAAALKRANPNLRDDEICLLLGCKVSELSKNKNDMREIFKDIFGDSINPFAV